VAMRRPRHALDRPPACAYLGRPKTPSEPGYGPGYGLAWCLLRTRSEYK